MEFHQIKELIKLMNDSSLTELDLSLGGDSIRMSKQAVFARLPAHLPEQAAVQAFSPIDAPVTILPDEKEEPQEGEIVRSPIVGTYYESSAPGKPALVKIGDAVKKGDALCIIEAMKVMNEIVSKYDGEIAQIFAKNEAMVEYNQPLFRIV